ncbi:MAG: OsmC family protein [Cyclobacteriaceae bacterium]|jgi:putative redox protein|nr:OsmC family protein [Cyclobacteriaceae bacterium]
MANTATVVYSGNLRTQATHTLSGNTIITDAPPDNNGKGEAFSPTDLVSSALCSCMITIMGIQAEKDGIDLVGLKAEVVKVMAVNPRRIAEIHIIFHHAGLKATEEQKQKLERAAHTCPVALSLSENLKQVITFNW